MKKIICLIIVFSLAVSLFSCARENDRDTESEKAETKTELTEPVAESETDTETSAESEPTQTAVEADYVIPDDLPEVDYELELYTKGILWSAGKQSYCKGDALPLSVAVNYIELMVIGSVDNIYNEEYLVYQKPDSYTLDLPLEIFKEIAANRFAFDIDYDGSEIISEDGTTISLSRQMRDNGPFPVIKDVIRDGDSITLVCDVAYPLYVNSDFSHASGGYKYLYSFDVTLRPAPDGGYTFTSYEITEGDVQE